MSKKDSEFMPLLTESESGRGSQQPAPSIDGIDMVHRVNQLMVDAMRGGWEVGSEVWGNFRDRCNITVTLKKIAPLDDGDAKLSSTLDTDEQRP